MRSIAPIALVLVMMSHLLAMAQEDRYAEYRLQKEKLPSCVYIQGVLSVLVGDAYIESYWLNLRYMQQTKISPAHGRGVMISFKGHGRIYLEGETLGSVIEKLNACNHMEKTNAE